jgi:hypothetical protein
MNAISSHERWHDPDSPEMQLTDSALLSLAKTDAMPAELRACVHEFGAQIVNTLMQHGITKAASIRDIVHSCWMGAREPHQRHGLRVRRSPVADQLDWLLEQKGAQITSATLLRLLKSHSLVIVPLHPSTTMVEASMATVSTHNRAVTKEQKHRFRLQSAIRASAQRMWPQIFSDEDGSQ